MKDIKEKQLEVLKDTINHYNSKNRSVDSTGLCVYFPSEKSEGCAVGRLIKDKTLCKKLGSEAIYNIIEELPQEIKDLEDDFLIELQRLHDVDKHWDENGLSEYGKNYVIAFVRNFKLESPF